MTTATTDTEIDIGEDAGICQGMTIAFTIPVTSDGVTPVDMVAGNYALEWTLYDGEYGNVLIPTKTLGAGIEIVDVVASNDGAKITLTNTDTVAAGVAKVDAGTWFHELWDRTSSRRICRGTFELLPSPRR